MTTDVIAIDLGARNCRAAVFRNGSVEILRNIDENLFIPSILTIKRGRNIVGSQALNTLPSNVIYDACQVKTSASQNDALKWYAQANSDGRYYIKDGPDTGQPVSQQEAIAMLLKHIKTEMAEQYLRRPVDRAVICVPAYAGENYRAVVYEAAQLAGFKDVQFFKQTRAAVSVFIKESLNSKPHDNNASYSKFAIISMGATSFEASVFETLNGRVKMLSNSGSAHFGGDNFTDLLANGVISEIKKMKPNEELFSKKGIKIIRDACEKAKVDLSNFNETKILIDIFGHEFNFSITREGFENICTKEFNEVDRYIANVFSPHRREISNVLLVGGSSRIPKLKEIVKSYISRDCTFVTGIVAEEAVITGAAISIGRENAPHHSMHQQQPQQPNIHHQRQSGSQQTTTEQRISQRPPVQQKEQTPEYSSQKSTEFEDNNQTRPGNMANESEAMPLLQNPPKNFVPLASCTEQLVNLLCEIEHRVEQLRNNANQLDQEKEAILDILNNVKPTLKILKLEKSEESEVILTVERILKRCKAVVSTPRNADEARALDDVNKGVQTDIAMGNNLIFPETHAVNINVGSLSFFKEALNQLTEAIGKLVSSVGFALSKNTTKKEDVSNSTSNPEEDSADTDIAKKKQKRESANQFTYKEGVAEAATTSQRFVSRNLEREKERNRRSGGHGATERQ